MRRPPQPVQSEDAGSDYFQLVAAAERCVRVALDREKLPPMNPAPILDWLHCMSEIPQE